MGTYIFVCRMQCLQVFLIVRAYMSRRYLLVVCVCLQVALYPVRCISIADTTPADVLDGDPAAHCDRVWNQTMGRRQNLYHHYKKYGINTKISLLSGKRSTAHYRILLLTEYVGKGHFRTSGPKTLLLHIGML